MKPDRTPDESIRGIVAGFCHRHGIVRIGLTPVAGLTVGRQLLRVDLDFAGDTKHAPYRASFKSGAAAALGSMVSHIDADGRLQFVDEAPEMAVLESALARFFDRIKRRIVKIRQEQSVQHIRFLGNRFLLNGTTEFLVVDEADGRLGVEIFKGDEPRRAHMLASSLLDGLYDGSIRSLDTD